MRDHFATLAQALIEGINEEPLWVTFLDRLVDATGGWRATLSFHPPGWEQGEGLQLVSSGITADSAIASHRRYGYPDNEVARERMDEGRAYSLADLIDWDAGEHAVFFKDVTEAIGITDARQMRVQEKGGVDAWLTVVRQQGKFGEDAGWLFHALAPLLRGMLHNYVAREQDRFAATMAQDAVHRLHFGWIALDAQGLIVGSDRFGEQLLETSGVLARDRQGRLGVRPPELQREVEAALGKLASGTSASPRAIPLRSDPWLDMLLVRATHKPLAATGAAQVIAYVHGDNWSSRDRQGQLADLFALSPKESMLALALCRGRSIAEAAGEIGITVETARSYSKSIYAKTGAKGQPDLVRIVMGSILALAPEVQGADPIRTG